MDVDVEGDDVLENDRRCVGWKYGSWADKPMRLSTASPNCESGCTPTERNHVNQIKKKKKNYIETYPPSMLDQLFSINFIESRYPDKLSLSVHEAVP